MGFGSIQLGGLASGLDTNAIISALLAVEAQPIRALESQKSERQSMVSAIGTFEGLVKDLRDKVRDMTSAIGSFFAHSVSNSDESVASVSVTGNPTAGSHSLIVNSLASSNRHAFDGIPDDTTALNGGQITFTYDGVDYVADVTAGDTINDVAAAINTVADGAVEATVVNSGTEAAPSYQLVLAGRDTGSAYEIIDLQSSVLDITATGDTELTPASDAVVVIDGLEVTRSTNLFADVIPGMSFTVQATTGGSAITFASEIDLEGTRTQIQELMDSFNEVVNFISDQSSFSEEAGAGGALFGDSLLSSVSSAVRSALFSIDLDDVQADTEGYSTLGLLGLDLQGDGTIDIDSSTFEEKLTGNMELFEEAFIGDAGFLTALETELNTLVNGPLDENGDPVMIGEQAIGSAFTRRREAIQSVISRIDDDIERAERSLEKTEERLILQFSNLEALMSTLNSQSAFLSSGLAFPT